MDGSDSGFSGLDSLPNPSRGHSRQHPQQRRFRRGRQCRNRRTENKKTGPSLRKARSFQRPSYLPSTVVGAGT